MPCTYGSSSILQPGRRQPRPEVDVLHRRDEVALGVESADRIEAVPPHGAEPGPERRRTPGALLVDVVMEQVAEGGDGARVGRAIVVRAEERTERRIVLEGPPDPDEGVVMREHVRVDEDEHVACRSDGAAVPGVRRAASFLDDDHLVGRLGRAPDRLQACREGRRRVRGRHDRAQARHAAILGRGLT